MPYKSPTTEFLWLLLIVLLAPCALPAQTDPARPLPDVLTLMHAVEAHQREAEAVEKNYTYTSSSKLVELNGSGGVKKTETRTFEIFWTDGVRQARLISKDGKPLSGDELKKEDDRLAEAVSKAKERRAAADADGKETDSHGRDEITLSRILELGAFTNPRRVQINGRDTIAIDFTGDPKAKVHNPGENAMREMSGTLWVDEADKSIEHLEGRFDHPFKVAGGLLMNVAQGTAFRIQNVRLNDEVWLPQSVHAHGQAHIMLFVGLNGDLTVQMSNYHRFRTSTKILPGLNKVDPDLTLPTGATAPVPPQ